MCGVFALLRGWSGRGALVGGVPPDHAGLVLGELAEGVGVEGPEGLRDGVLEVLDDDVEGEVLRRGELQPQAGVDRDDVADLLEGDLGDGPHQREHELGELPAGRGELVGLGVVTDIGSLHHHILVGGRGTAEIGVVDDLHLRFLSVALSGTFPNR